MIFEVASGFEAGDFDASDGITIEIGEGAEVGDSEEVICGVLVNGDGIVCGGRWIVGGVDVNGECVAGSAVCVAVVDLEFEGCLLYTSPSPRDATLSRMPSSA